MYPYMIGQPMGLAYGQPLPAYQQGYWQLPPPVGYAMPAMPGYGQPPQGYGTQMPPLGGYQQGYQPVFTGWETSYKYNIQNNMGQQINFAAEDRSSRHFAMLAPPYHLYPFTAQFHV